jgi:5S rRNA maturation endonuclease (ribonuclease M5)
VNTRKLLGWLGVSTVEIDWLSLESLRHRGLGDLASERNEESKIISANITFNKVQLPNGSRNIRSTDCRFVDYLAGRGLKYNQYNFMITPNGKFRNKNRIIIPYTHGGVIVGYTSRFLDNNLPKYLNEQQPGYIFGLDLQKSNWKYVIVVEGVLDAISINGMAVLHNKISDKQAKQLMRLAQEKEVIVVPDHDKAGKKLVDDAVKYGFSVSTPLWGNDIKDVNDAVLVNGKIATILDIITHRNNGVKSKLAIKLKLRKKFERI